MKFARMEFIRLGKAWCATVNGIQVCMDTAIASSKLAAEEIEFARNFKPKNGRPKSENL